MTKPTHWIIAFSIFLSISANASAEPPGVMKREFLYQTAPFPEAHASTIAETPDRGLVAAFFGGEYERHPSVGIWVVRQTGADGGWSEPVEVADGVQDDGKRLPCWNPVLFQPKQGPLMLFYKVGPSPSRWWGMLKTSTDQGLTWSKEQRLPDGILGPIKNKPVQLSSGLIVCPSSTESPDEADLWRAHFELTSDLGRTWKKTAPAAHADASKEPNVIQPTILIHKGGKLQALGRSKGKRIFETWSDDQGQTWTPISYTSLPNPDSGIDAVTLRDGRHFLVYNHSERGRVPLNLAVSQDGENWSAAAIVEDQPLRHGYAYPACIQTSDGLVHITYTWNRQKIVHLVVDPEKLVTRPITGGKWPE